MTRRTFDPRGHCPPIRLPSHGHRQPAFVRRERRARHEATPLAALIADAVSLRALSVSGVSDPRLMRGLLVTKRVHYRHTGSTLFLSSRGNLLQAALGGDALLGGLIGDGWTPLSSEPYR